jgi:hypothetical protein
MPHLDKNQKLFSGIVALVVIAALVCLLSWFFGIWPYDNYIELDYFDIVKPNYHQFEPDYYDQLIPDHVQKVDWYQKEEQNQELMFLADDQDNMNMQEDPMNQELILLADDQDDIERQPFIEEQQIFAEEQPSTIPDDMIQKDTQCRMIETDFKKLYPNASIPLEFGLPSQNNGICTLTYDMMAI